MLRVPFSINRYLLSQTLAVICFLFSVFFLGKPLFNMFGETVGFVAAVLFSSTRSLSWANDRQLSNMKPGAAPAYNLSYLILLLVCFSRAGGWYLRALCMRETSDKGRKFKTSTYSNFSTCKRLAPASGMRRGSYVKSFQLYTHTRVRK